MAKKILALVLAIMMIAALTVSAFANNSDEDKNGSITISNVQDGKTYTAYKIFDVTYDGKGSFAYTISNTSPWLNVVKEFFDTPATADATVLTVKAKESFSAAAFAAALNAMEGKPTGTTLAGKVTENLALGYWFVTTTTGSLCNLTTTDPDATIVDKNEPLTMTKTVDDDVVEVGQEVTYTVTAKIPAGVTGYTKFKYEIRDTLPDGLKYEYISKVTINNTEFPKTELPEGSTFKQGGAYPNPTGTTLNGFDVTVDLCNAAWKNYLGKTVVIEYKAIVTEAIVDLASVTNTAYLVYSDDPADADSTDEITNTATIYSLNVDVKKVSSEGGAALSGAEFVLYKGTGADRAYYKWVAATESSTADVQWVKLPEGKSDVSAALKADPNFCTKGKTGADGKLDITFDGLGLDEATTGTYCLEEIKSPLGYALPKDPFAVVITKNVNEETGAVTFSATVNGVEGSATVGNDLTVTGTIANVPGQELPETGGIGTTIFYVLGSVFVLGAVVILLTKKRA